MTTLKPYNIRYHWASYLHDVVNRIHRYDDEGAVAEARRRAEAQVRCTVTAETVEGEVLATFQGGGGAEG